MTTRREFIRALPAAGAAFTAAGIVVAEGGAAWSQQIDPLEGHFAPKGKPPSQFTLDILNQARNALPFADQRDFEEQNRGLIASRQNLKIIADAGHVAWDMERFQFLNAQDQFDTIHPSLHRQSKLNNNYGLYEVIAGHIYQVRGFDLANITFIRGKTGWIVFDTMVSSET